MMQIDELKEHTSSMLASIQKDIKAISIKTSSAACDSDGITKLMKSAREGLYDLVFDELIVEPGVDVNACDNHGYTALMHAVVGGDEYIVWKLISKGANVNAKSKCGTTALDIAAGTCEQKVLQRAASRGETVLEVDPYCGERIILEGNRKIIRSLIRAGADVNTKDNKGETPLMNAIFAGDEETIKMLIAAGADVNTKDNSGMTLLMTLAKSVSIKKEYGEFNNNAKKKVKAIRQILIDAGANS